MGRYGRPDIRAADGAVRPTKTEDMIQAGPDPVPPSYTMPPPGARHSRSLLLARKLKRGLDIAVAATSIFLLLPLMLLVAGTISAIDRASPFERETRLGSGGRSFECLRFRTTEPGRPASVAKPSGSATSETPRRVTAIGRVLGTTSLDQLPMLVNVLRGEMSLVGPRPLPVDAAAFVPDVDVRLSMAPGLTGAWQVEATPDATEADRAALDLDYARRWSLRRDLAIMLRGVAAAFARQDES